jgi:hypothetical protein
MNCEQFLTHLDDLLIAPPDEATRSEMDAHALVCPSCADAFEAAQEAAASIHLSHMFHASSILKEKIMGKIWEQVEVESRTSAKRKHAFGRFWKMGLGAAAALVGVIIVGVVVLCRPPAPAYALEQTVEANRGIRSIHLRCEPAGEGIEDLWAQFEENGKLTHLRMNFPNTEDGPKEVVWQEGKAEVWFKAKGSHLICKKEDMQEKLKMTADSVNPRLLVENVYQRQAAGKVRIETKQPTAPGEPITLTISSIESPKETFIYRVDPETKLLKQIEKDGAIKKFLDYNAPIDPSVFTLNPPAGTMRIDQTTQEIGLVQGKLSDRDIAVQVAREFFEALIARDYAKAGRLLEGIPAAEMEKMFGEMKVLRIVSIGEPTPSPQNGGKAVHLLCKIEIEKDGARSVKEFNPGVRIVDEEQPDRWDIFGGI